MGWRKGVSQINFGISCIWIFSEHSFFSIVNDIGSFSFILKHWITLMQAKTTLAIKGAKIGRVVQMPQLVWPLSKNSLAVIRSVVMSTVGRRNLKMKNVETIEKWFHLGLSNTPAFLESKKFKTFWLNFDLKSCLSVLFSLHTTT